MGLKPLRRVLALAIGIAFAVPAGAETLRLATYSPDLTRDGPGLLLRDLGREDAQIDAVLRVIAAADADVLLLTGFDWDHDGLALTAFRDRLADSGHPYPYAIAEQPNSGVQTGLDLDQDGRFGGREDAQGYGRFTGARGMALLSRKPVRLERDLTTMLWRDLPGNLMPDVPDEVAAVQRLSSTAHWDVVVETGGVDLHLLTLSATPPMFDGPEGRNIRRNHDEVALWLAEAPAERWVVMGKINLNLDQGIGMTDALSALLDRSMDTRPKSPAGGLVTADWGPDRDGTPRQQRVEYILPSRDLEVVDSGILWPETGALAEDVVTASRHRLVWLDLKIP